MSAFLPPLLTETEVDRILREVTEEGSTTEGLGRVLKAFYARTDKSAVDPALVKKKAEELLAKPM